VDGVQRLIGKKVNADALTRISAESPFRLRFDRMEWRP
jgi:hypothetical protein